MLNIAQYVGLISQISWPWINQQICFSFSFNWLFVNFWECIKYYVRLYILWPIFNPPLTAPETYIARLCLCFCQSICASKTICFRNICSISWWIFTKLLSLVHLGTKMNWLSFGVKGQGHILAVPALDPAVEWSFLISKTKLTKRYRLDLGCSSQREWLICEIISMITDQSQTVTA